MQQASQAQLGALQGTVGAGTTNIGTVLGSDIQAYQNPYQQNVIQGLQTEAQRNMQTGLNTIGSQATAAGAFGGSRHGIAEGQMMGDVQRGLNQQIGQLQQQGFTQAQNMAQQDIANRLSQANLGLSAASQLGNLGQQSFNMGRTIQQDVAQQGAQQQMLNQALIDAAKGQFATYQGYPAAGLGIMTQALGASPHGQTQTGTRQLGIMDYLTAGATIYGMSDIRLKVNIQEYGKLDNGIKTYTWDWTEEGRELAGDQIGHGVIAQEVAEMFPEAVVTGDHGYMMVDYSHPELKGAI